MARKPDVPCSVCGRLLWSGSTSLPAGVRLCRACRRARREAQAASCSVCGEEFLAAWIGGKRRRTCSHACADASRVRGLDKAREALRSSRECEDCLLPVDTPGVVALCDRCRVVRKAVRDREHWQQKNRRRRAALRAVPSESYTLAEIASRDGHVCQLCRAEVDMTLVVPDLWAPTVDHVVPLVAGGDDTRANVQLAHFVCNSRKGAALEPVA